VPRPRAPEGITRPSWPAKAPAAKLDALLPLAKAVAGRFCQRFPSRAAPDIRAAAFLGAWLVALRHPEGDPERLRRYAIARIKGAVLDELRRLDWAPRRARAGNYASPVVYLDDVGFGELAAALSATPETESDLDDLARVERLYEALARLPERDRMILLEVEVKERRPVDLARELGVSEARISQLRTRAKARLREAMGAVDSARDSPGPRT